jgi:hypothetical protein
MSCEVPIAGDKTGKQTQRPSGKPLGSNLVFGLEARYRRGKGREEGAQRFSLSQHRQLTPWPNKVERWRGER